MLIQLIENQCSKGEIQAELRFSDPANSTFPVTILHPHNQEAEAGLEWYFEQYINEPFTAGSTVNRTVDNYIFRYGTDLFRQIFAAFEARDLFYQTVNEVGYAAITFAIKGKSKAFEFQTILWETMRDPENSNKPLAAWGVKIIRTSDAGSLLQSRVNLSPTLNLLIITSRPSEENDVNYRTIQRPLIGQLRDAYQQRINAVILRPGTFKSLKNHLDEQGDGYYHIIHFDLHGEVLAFDELNEKKLRGEATFSGTYSFGNSPQSFQVVWGRYIDMGPYEGKKAFLFFESEKKGVAEPWSAEEIADLIGSKQIPVCILNACQSAKQEGDASETNLARFIHEKGVAVVLAMRYSVSTSAAAILMERLYDCIFDQVAIDKALSLARVRLFDQKERDAALGYKIDLEDWALPVVYQRKEVQFEFREFTKEETRKTLERLAKRPVFPEPEFGFRGRDLDILKIEKLLSGQVNHLLLRGMLGVGKSALLRYLAGWWVTTNFRQVQTVVFLDFATPKTFASLIDEIAEKTMDPARWKTLQPLSTELRAQGLLNQLNGAPYGLIFDNIFEFNDPKTRSFLSAIRGKSFVVYGSVNPEEFLKPFTFQDNVHFMEGLDKEAAFSLAANIVERRTPHHWPDLMRTHRFELTYLMELLAGFPSAMEQVLPLLRELTVPELLEKFNNGTLPL